MTPSQNLRDFLRVIIGYSFINVKDHLVFRIKMDNLPRRTKKKNRFTSFEEELKIVSVKKIFSCKNHQPSSQKKSALNYFEPV